MHTSNLFVPSHDATPEIERQNAPRLCMCCCCCCCCYTMMSFSQPSLASSGTSVALTAPRDPQPLGLVPRLPRLLLLFPRLVHAQRPLLGLLHRPRQRLGRH